MIKKKKSTKKSLRKGTKKIGRRTKKLVVKRSRKKGMKMAPFAQVPPSVTGSSSKKEEKATVKSTPNDPMALVRYSQPWNDSGSNSRNRGNNEDTQKLLKDKEEETKKLLKDKEEETQKVIKSKEDEILRLTNSRGDIFALGPDIFEDEMIIKKPKKGVIAINPKGETINIDPLLIQKYDNAVTQFSTVQKERKNLEKQLNQMKQDNQDLIDLRDLNETKIKEQNQKLDEYVKDIEDLNDLKDQLENEKQLLENERIRLEGEKNVAEKALKTTKDQVDADILDLQQQLEDMEKDLEDMEEEYRVTKEENDLLIQQTEKLNEYIKEESDKTNALIKQREDLNNEIIRLNMLIPDLEAEQRRLKEDNEGIAEDNKKLENDLIELKKSKIFSFLTKDNLVSIYDEAFQDRGGLSTKEDFFNAIATEFPDVLTNYAKTLSLDVLDVKDINVKNQIREEIVKELVGEVNDQLDREAEQQQFDDYLEDLTKDITDADEKQKAKASLALLDQKTKEKEQKDLDDDLNIREKVRDKFIERTTKEFKDRLKTMSDDEFDNIVSMLFTQDEIDNMQVDDQFLEELTDRYVINQPYDFETEKLIVNLDDLLPATSGAGKAESGLWNTEIEHFMRKYKKKGFKGVFPIDYLHKIPFKKSDKVVSFIMNTAPSNVKVGHWVAVKMDPETLEYYDSFGEEPPKAFVKAMKQLMKKWSSNNLVQFKINRVKFQRANSDNCGFFAMKFLDDRYKGETFKDATGFQRLSKVLKGEKEIKAFKERVKEFNSL